MKLEKMAIALIGLSYKVDNGSIKISFDKVDSDYALRVTFFDEENDNKTITIYEDDAQEVRHYLFNKCIILIKDYDKALEFIKERI